MVIKEDSVNNEDPTVAICIKDIDLPKSSYEQSKRNEKWIEKGKALMQSENMDSKSKEEKEQKECHSMHYINEMDNKSSKGSSKEKLCFTSP